MANRNKIPSENHFLRMREELYELSEWAYSLPEATQKQKEKKSLIREELYKARKALDVLVEATSTKDS